MKLIYYSHQPLGALRSIQQPCVNPKPRGLWVSVEGKDDWLEWCMENDFGLNYLTYAHDVALAPGASVAVLNGAGDIDAFTHEFGERSSHHVYIRWLEVAKRWDGLIIAPYVWSRRRGGSAGWYYGWDCASGCIWNPRAIASVALRERVTPA